MASGNILPFYREDCRGVAFTLRRYERESLYAHIDHSVRVNRVVFSRSIAPNVTVYSLRSKAADGRVNVIIPGPVSGDLFDIGIGAWSAPHLYLGCSSTLILDVENHGSADLRFEAFVEYDECPWEKSVYRCPACVIQI